MRQGGRNRSARGGTEPENNWVTQWGISDRLRLRVSLSLPTYTSASFFPASLCTIFSFPSGHHGRWMLHASWDCMSSVYRQQRWGCLNPNCSCQGEGNCLAHLGSGVAVGPLATTREGDLCVGPSPEKQRYEQRENNFSYLRSYFCRHLILIFYFFIFFFWGNQTHFL